jgi:hypothetical protein
VQKITLFFPARLSMAQAMDLVASSATDTAVPCAPQGGHRGAAGPLDQSIEEKVLDLEHRASLAERARATARRKQMDKWVRDDEAEKAVLRQQYVRVAITFLDMREFFKFACARGIPTAGVMHGECCSKLTNGHTLHLNARYLTTDPEQLERDAAAAPTAEKPTGGGDAAFKRFLKQCHVDDGPAADRQCRASLMVFAMSNVPVADWHLVTRFCGVKAVPTNGAVAVNFDCMWLNRTSMARY